MVMCTYAYFLKMFKREKEVQKEKVEEKKGKQARSTTERGIKILYTGIDYVHMMRLVGQHGIPNLSLHTFICTQIDV